MVMVYVIFGYALFETSEKVYYIVIYFGGTNGADNTVSERT